VARGSSLNTVSPGKQTNCPSFEALLSSPFNPAVAMPSCKHHLERTKIKRAAHFSLSSWCSSFTTHTCRLVRSPFNSHAQSKSASTAKLTGTLPYLSLLANLSILQKITDLIFYFGFRHVLRMSVSQCSLFKQPHLGLRCHHPVAFGLSLESMPGNVPHPDGGHRLRNLQQGSVTST